MEGLAHSYDFEICNEPTDLSRFVVDLRARHLHYWEPFSSIHVTDSSMLFEFCFSPKSGLSEAQNGYGFGMIPYGYGLRDGHLLSLV